MGKHLALLLQCDHMDSRRQHIFIANIVLDKNDEFAIERNRLHAANSLFIAADITVSESVMSEPRESRQSQQPKWGKLPVGFFSPGATDCRK